VDSQRQLVYAIIATMSGGDMMVTHFHIDDTIAAADHRRIGISG